MDQTVHHFEASVYNVNPSKTATDVLDLSVSVEWCHDLGHEAWGDAYDPAVVLVGCQPFQDREPLQNLLVAAASDLVVVVRPAILIIIRLLIILLVSTDSPDTDTSVLSPAVDACLGGFVFKQGGYALDGPRELG